MKLSNVFYILLLSIFSHTVQAKVYLERPAQKTTLNLSQPCIGCLEFNDSIGSLSSHLFKVQLHQLITNPLIRGILLVIDSGGGAVNASFELFELVKQARTIKPIVTYVDGVCASGAYLLASPTHIVASPMSVIGSIGVVMNFEQTEPEEFKADGYKGKVKRLQFTRGKFKRLGGPGIAPLNAEEEAMLNKDMDFMYQQFCVAVAGQRNLTIEQVQAQEAQTFPGVLALEHGLVNQVGTLADAVECLKKEIIKRGMPISDDIDLMHSMIKPE